MSITITIELSTEDRARIDKIIDILEARVIQEQTYLEHTIDKPADDDVSKALREVLAEAKQMESEANTVTVEAPKIAQKAAETSTPPTVPQEEEQPAGEEPSQAEPTKTVTHDDLMAKVIELSAKDPSLKAQAREIVLAYAPRVKAVPEDKLNECYKKIVALEG